MVILEKGLAKGLTLSDKVSLVMNKKPKYVFQDTLFEDIKILFIKGKYRAIPVIDKNHKVINCYFQEFFF